MIRVNVLPDRAAPAPIVCAMCREATADLVWLGTSWRCRPCKRRYQKEWRAANADRHREHNRRYYEKNGDAIRARNRARAAVVNARRRPEYVLLHSAKHRAKVLGVAFDLIESDIRIPARCPVLGIEIAKGEGYLADGSPTIDRLDPDGGYTKDNIAVISWRANRLKSDARPEELERLAAWVRNGGGAH